MRLSAHQSAAAVVCIVGLWPFVLLAAAYRSRYALVVMINGLFFHVSKLVRSQLMYVAMIFDLVCNIFFAVVGNLVTPWQPQTLKLTLASTMCFLINCNYFAQSQPIVSAVLHVALTQCPLALCLAVYVEAL